MICDRDEFENMSFTTDSVIAIETVKRKLRMQESFTICKFWLAGQKCEDKERERCRFRHARGEKTVVCKHWLRGLCKKNEDCEFLHVYDMAKMPPCHFYNTFGRCSNPDCLFLHLNLIDQVKECPWYARGFCKHGQKCRNKHKRSRGCQSYILGFCIDGPKCPLGHPKYELPTTSATNLFRSRRPLRPLNEVTCFKCGQQGHYANACGFQSQRAVQEGPEYAARTANITCFKCGQLGHYANKCPTSTIVRMVPMKMQQTLSNGAVTQLDEKPIPNAVTEVTQAPTRSRPFIPGTMHRPSLPLN